jgi:hypothetical protein
MKPTYEGVPTMPDTLGTPTDDDSEVVRDGERIVIRMSMMDSLQHAVAGGIAVADAVGHRPGSLPMTNAERERRTALYQDHDKRLSERWMTLQPTADTPDAGHSTGDARLDAYARYQQRVTDAWRHP